MRQVESLLVGATAYAVGYAAGNKNCMIVEEGQWVGSDFSATLNAECVDVQALQTAAAKTLADDLTARGLLDEAGRVHILPIAAKLSEELLRLNVTVLFDATTVSVEKEKDGYVVTIFHRNGFEKIEAKRVIDTRACIYVDGAKKFFCTMITDMDESISLPDAKLLKGGLGESTLKMYVDQETDYQSARRKTEEFLLNFLKGAKIYAYANSFGYEYDSVCEKRIMPNYKHIPSLSFGNVLFAYENGFIAGVEDEKNGCI